MIVLRLIILAILIVREPGEHPLYPRTAEALERIKVAILPFFEENTNLNKNVPCTFINGYFPLFQEPAELSTSALPLASSRVAVHQHYYYYDC